MAITALPTPPSRQDPTNFATRADAFMAALPTFATEATALQADVNAKQAAAASSRTEAATSETNAAASAATAVNAPGTSATSVTSLTIASSGSVSLTLAQTGKAFAVGQSVVLAMTATPTTWMNGVITAFTSGTGAMTVALAMASGSGTASAWTISLTSPALANGTVTPAKLSTGAPIWDANGDLGISVTPSAWGSSFKAIEASAPITLVSQSSWAGLGVNAYQDGGGWKYKNNGYAYHYVAAGLGNASGYQWNIAASGVAGGAITWAQAMSLDTSGNLLLGTTNMIGVGARANVYSAMGNALHVQSGAGAANNFVSYNSTGVASFVIANNGNATNTNNSYGAISDAKLKENITDATPKLDGLLRVRIVNYTLKAAPELKQLGVIAQELERVFPGMVDESEDVDADGNALGTVTKSVKYSVFVPMLIKAIQEQQAQIEQLKADVEALQTTHG